MNKLLVILALGAAVALDNVSACGPEPHPSGIAWDGTAYTAVWASPSSFKVTVWAARFDPRDFNGADEGGLTMLSASRFPEKVLRLSSVRATPEVVSGDGGSLVAVHGGDGALWTVGLDEGGARKREGAAIANDVDLLCVGPVWSGDSYYVAYAAGSRLHLVRLDRDAAVTDRRSFELERPTRCAMAAGDGRVAVVASAAAPRAAATVHADDQTLVIQAGGPGPLRLLRRPGGWTILVAGGEGLELVELRDDGGRPDTRPVPAGIDRGSVDLGRNDAGVFLTWLDGRIVKIMFPSDSEPGTFRTERRPLGTRAIGHDGTCALTWTTDGTKVWVLQARSCRPR